MCRTHLMHRSILDTFYFSTFDLTKSWLKLPSKKASFGGINFNVFLFSFCCFLEQLWLFPVPVGVFARKIRFSWFQNDAVSKFHRKLGFFGLRDHIQQYMSISKNHYFSQFLCQKPVTSGFFWPSLGFFARRIRFQRFQNGLTHKFHRKMVFQA